MERDKFLESFKYISTPVKNENQRQQFNNQEIKKFYDEADELFKKELGKSVYGNDFDTRFSR